MSTQTYSTASTAKRGTARSLAKIDTFVSERIQVNIHANDDGRFYAVGIVDMPLIDVPADMMVVLNAAFHSVVESQAVIDARKAESLLDETTAPVIAKRSSGYINEVSNHRGVVAEVWAICDAIGDKLPRKDVVKICRDQGIAYGTARTQYQKWFKNRRG